MGFSMCSCVRFTSGVLAVACSFAACPAEKTTVEAAPLSVKSLESNNKWDVSISNRTKFGSPLYVTLRQSESHWEIDRLFNTPPKIKRSQDIELFMATRDFQQWTNFYSDVRTDCDSFEERESDFHSVCTSSLADKRTGVAVVGLLFGGNGKAQFSYVDDKVKSAINSIRPHQAMEVLAAFEQNSLAAQNHAVNPKVERLQLENAQIVARQSAPIGAKDWCEQTVKYFGAVMQVEQNFTCQNYGVVSEDDLRNEGWAITNKMERKVGFSPQLITVHDIAIEKSPRRLYRN